VKRGLVAGAVALAWGLVVAIGAYAMTRAIQLLVHPDPNPALVVWSAHAGYFWRAWTVSYAGGIAAFVALLVARERVEASARSLILAIGVTAVLLALQAAFFP
jgi:hypothetical protein